MGDVLSLETRAQIERTKVRRQPSNELKRQVMEGRERLQNLLNRREEIEGDGNAIRTAIVEEFKTAERIDDKAITQILEGKKKRRETFDIDIEESAATYEHELDQLDRLINGEQAKLASLAEEIPNPIHQAKVAPAIVDASDEADSEC